VDITAVRMLVELGDDLKRQGIDIVLAHDLGQVEDLLAKGDVTAGIHGIYPTVAAAVAAIAEPSVAGQHGLPSSTKAAEAAQHDGP